MRIFSSLLMITFTFLVPSSTVWADSLCGVFTATAYAPPEDKGAVLIVNPKAVSSTKLRLTNEMKIPRENIGKLLEVHFRLKATCYVECPTALVKIVRVVSPFESFKPFYRNEDALVKAEKCVKTPFETMESP